ncbi:GntR family transcriptional regulator [Paenibacillus sp. GYB003]|uniref:GntR family transcriptional regulator n=1 Tax=Paenibacillus sp. GYB003 TaxID=2994392 RepID=UPI002F96BB5D
MEASPLVKERLVDQLRRLIAPLQTGSLVKIPSERQLAESLQASRVSVRAAIRVLTGEGLLVQLRGKGTYIVPAVRLETLYLLRSPDIKDNDPFYNHFLVEITNLAAKQGIKLAMVHPDRPPGTDAASPLVVIGMLDDSRLDELTAAYGTLFAVERYAHRDDIAQVYFDDYRIGSKAAKTLFDHGYRNLALLGGPDKYASANLRKLGFLDKARGCGVPVRVMTDKMNWEGGVRAADLVAASPGDRPDAVFAVNDWMAVGFIQRLREHGLHVPAHMAVIGCDDIPLASECSPRLATFKLDMKHLVEELLAAIHRHHAGRSAERNEVVLPAVFIGRESLAHKTIR